jgi:ComF family protein
LAFPACDGCGFSTEGRCRLNAMDWKPVNAEADELPIDTGRELSPASVFNFKSLFSSAKTGISHAAEAAIRLVYPPSCVACGGATSDIHALCPGCWSRIGFISRPYCERLGTPFSIDLGGPLHSPAAIADPPVFTRARAVCRYDDVARELVHKLKFGDRPELGRALANMMLLAGAEVLDDADLLVPVPLHRVRLWTRRFNQAAVLTRIIGKRRGLPVELQALARIKHTRPQVGLSRPQRADNLQGAFRVAKSARPLIEGRRIVMIDDVLTTGATANAASRALLRAGAISVDVLTFTRVVASS